MKISKEQTMYRTRLNHLLNRELEHQGWILHPLCWGASYDFPKYDMIMLFHHPRSEVKLKIVIMSQPDIKLTEKLELWDPDHVIYETLEARPRVREIEKLLLRAARLFDEIARLNCRAKIKFTKRDFKHYELKRSRSAERFTCKVVL